MECNGTFTVSALSAASISSMTRRSMLLNASSPFRTGLFKQASRVQADLIDRVKISVSVGRAHTRTHSFESRYRLEAVCVFVSRGMLALSGNASSDSR